MSLDLVVAVPDNDIEQSLRGLLTERTASLRIRPIRYEILKHPDKDPGCYLRAHELLASYADDARHGLVVLDSAWDGAPTNDPTKLAQAVESRLERAWGTRARCVVIHPEVEVWIWSDSPVVTEVLGWRGREPGLRSWLREQSMWPEDISKPPDPKAAFLKAVRLSRVKPSAALFRKLAGTVGLSRCTDPALRQLVEILSAWFPVDAAA